MKKTSLLYNERPIVFPPQLAIRLKSANKAIFVQQLHYWLTQTKPNGEHYGTEVDGIVWIKNTVEDWRLQIAPWISKRGFEKIIKQLKEDKIILAENLNKNHFEATLSYTLNYLHPLLEGNCRIIQSSVCGHANGGIDTEQSAESDTEQSAESDTEQSAVRHKAEKTPIETKRKESNEKIFSIRDVNTSPNPSVSLKDKQNQVVNEDLNDYLQMKRDRKAKKTNKPYKKKNTYIKNGTLDRDTGLVISLTDNIPDSEVDRLAETYKLTKEEVLEKKKTYIDWVNGSSYDPKVWGKNMLIYVERFCKQQSIKKKTKSNKNEKGKKYKCFNDMFDDIVKEYNVEVFKKKDE